MTRTAGWPKRSIAALIATVTLIAAACTDGGDEAGGSDGFAESESGGERSEDPAGPSVSDTPEESLSESDDAPDQASSIEDLESQWAQSRAEVVAAIRSDGLGVESGVLIGSDGPWVDLADCPSDWFDTEGVDGDVVTIAQTLALTGALSQFADSALGLQAYLEYVNSTGGVAGMTIELRLENDRFAAETTVELVDELIESGSVFWVNTVGFPGTAAVRDELNRQCVPQPLVFSNHPAWGDPVDHPWTTGYQLSFRTEALLWGAWLEENLGTDLPVTVAALVSDDDLGAIYEQAFSEWVDANSDVVADFSVVTHPTGASSVSAEMAQLAAIQPDVVLAMTQGQACTSAMAEASSQGLIESTLALFAPSVCRDPQAFMLPAGGAAEGWWVVDGGFKGTSDPAYADDPWVAWVNEQLEARGYATSNELYAAGFAHGWAHVEALRIAAELDGGLTRTNYLLALRTMSLPNPNLVDGVVFEVDGNNDAFFVEGSQFSQWDAAAGEWVQRGDVIDLNGQTGTCSWEPGAGC